MIRLLHVETLQLKEWYDPKTWPAYAILSHRWKHEKDGEKLRDLEVSYQEWKDGEGCDQGREKIKRACEAVRAFPKLKWIWIDSCCIDKRDSVEHTEAINSMYEWYAKSQVCIAYLDDVDTFEDARASDWFRRAWTLQELIAPERVLFYNTYWQACGSRNDYKPDLSSQKQHMFKDRSKAIAEITQIDIHLLQLQDRKAIKRRLDLIPACQKMSWASDRKATKDEDIAYCLIGLFNIPQMYLKRGEGKRAFIRLQEEIIKQSNDLTLFAWKTSENLWDPEDACIDDNYIDYTRPDQELGSQSLFFAESPPTLLHGAFACGPSHFRDASQIVPTQPAVYNDEITVTGRGVKFPTPLLGSGPFQHFVLPLHCRSAASPDSSQLLGIELRFIGGSIYARSNCTKLHQVSMDVKLILNQDDVFLAHYVHRFQEHITPLHKHAIRLPDTILGELKRVSVSPGYLWSRKHNLVLTSGCRFFVGFASYRSNNGDLDITLIFGLDHMQRPWFCLSNVDPSYAPLALESRKLYLERIWRPASQNDLTAYLNQPKPFAFYTGRQTIQGSIRVDECQYFGRDVFAVEFIPQIPDDAEHGTASSAASTTLCEYYSEGKSHPKPPVGPSSSAFTTPTTSATMSIARSSHQCPPTTSTAIPAHGTIVSNLQNGSSQTFGPPTVYPEDRAHGSSSRPSPGLDDDYNAPPGLSVPSTGNILTPPEPPEYEPVGVSYASDEVYEQLYRPTQPYGAPISTGEHSGLSGSVGSTDVTQFGQSAVGPSNNPSRGTLAALQPYTLPSGKLYFPRQPIWATTQSGGSVAPVGVFPNGAVGTTQLAQVPANLSNHSIENIFAVPQSQSYTHLPGTSLFPQQSPDVPIVPARSDLGSAGVTMMGSAGGIQTHPFIYNYPSAPNGPMEAPINNPFLTNNSAQIAPLVSHPALPTSDQPQPNPQLGYIDMNPAQSNPHQQLLMSGTLPDAYVNMQQSRSAPGQAFPNFTAPMMQALPTYSGPLGNALPTYPKPPVPLRSNT